MAKILLIDDDQQVREMLRRMLEGGGYDVMEAKHGKEGLAFLRESPVDIVITDMVMPEQDGIETIVKLRKDYQGIKIIAISGDCRGDPDKYLYMAKQLGAKHTLRKPFRREELLTAVADLACAERA